MRVLSINTGSSSLKLALVAMPGGERLHGARADGLRRAEDFAAALAASFAGLSQAPEAVGHRVVAPRTAWTAARRLDAALLAELEELRPLAPDHLPQALAAISAAQRAWPDLPQIACSDSSFHASLPAAARHLALPRTLANQGVLRYGYHGLSCEFVMSELGQPAPARVVIAHLGNGCSLTAVREGRSVETTMGFTPLGGLVMSTRCGDLDPGVPLYLLRQGGYTAERLNQMLNHEAGLKGLAGTGDMKALLADPRPQAAEAVEVFVHQARKHLGALAAVLGGVDLLVFTGGIGEHAEAIRSRITEGMNWLSPAGKLAMRVIATDEELMIARHTWAAVREGARNVPL